MKIPVIFSLGRALGCGHDADEALDTGRRVTRA
jgi:hypothetical protein